MNVAYRIPLLAGFTFGIIATASSSHAQSDDFNDNNADGWTEFNPVQIASFTASGGTYRIESAASPNPGEWGPARAAALRQDVDDYESFCVMVDIVAYKEPAPNKDTAIGVMARVQRNPAPGETRGYVFTFQPGISDVQISRIKDEQLDAAIASAPFSPDPGSIFRMVLFGYGNYFEGRVYDVTDLTNPLVEISGSDVSGEGYDSGVCGLVVLDYSQPEFDQPIDVRLFTLPGADPVEYLQHSLGADSTGHAFAT